MARRPRTLHIADNLDLPLDLITGTQAIIATIGGGKSYLAQVEAEEMLEYRQQIVVFDPTDAWNGLRSSADGRHDGYPIVIIGGKRGDFPLDPNAGPAIARAILKGRFSCIICTDGLSDEDEVRLIRTVCEVLFRENTGPLHVFMDEVDLYCAQVPGTPEAFKAMRAVSRIVRRGRLKGLGVTLITQRPADVNKQVLSQCKVLMVLGMEHNTDIEPIERWIKNKRNPELVKELINSLTTLAPGEAWAWSPRLKLYQRFRARAKRTFDSGATPKVGQKRRVAKRLAPVDLQRLGATITSMVQRQKEEDPIALKAEIARLKKELTLRVPMIAEAAAVKAPKIVTKYILKDGQLKRIERVIDRGAKVALQLAALTDKTMPSTGAISEALVQLRMTIGAYKSVPPTIVPYASVKEVPKTPEGTWKVLGGPSELGRGAASAQFVAKAPQESKSAGIQGPLSKMERAFLTMLAQHPNGLTRKQILIFTGYANSGTVGSAFSRLTSERFVTTESGRMQLTALGQKTLGPVTPLPLGTDLCEQLFNGLVGDLSKMERAFLGRVAKAYPNAIGRTETRGDYANSGTVGSAFSRMIAKGYFTKVPGGVRLADELTG